MRGSLSSYIAPTHTLPHDAATPQAARRTITLAARNRAGTTNVYTFLADLITDRSGHMSAEVVADDSTITTMFSTLRLPSPLAAVQATHVGPDIGGSCNSVCWADANWNYNKYDDSSALYCSDSNNNSYTGSYGSYSCTDGNNRYGVQTSDTTSNSGNFYQPYFQCSEFVSRALSQNQDIPGLTNGGVNGSLPPSSTVGSYSYGNFPFTYMGNSYSGDSIYYLTDTGTRSGSSGIAGLYEYLVDAGLGYSLGQSLSSARPGDIVFFYQGAVTPANREHVMIITSTQGSVSSTQVDGHNVDAYHASLGSYTTHLGYEVIHLRNDVGSFGNATLSGSWNYTVDNYGQSIEWAYTGCSTCDTAGASYTFASGYQCAIAVYVPQYDATAKSTLG